MSLADQITRLPHAYDPELGADACAALPDLGPDLRTLISGTAGSSPYLKSLIDIEADWLPAALQDPDSALQECFAEMQGLAPDQLKPGLRRGKRRMALLTALADIAGAWPLGKVTGVLTDFAALACDLTLKAEIAQLIRRGKIPGQTEDDVAAAAGLVVLAMGKMGAHELNYSSDIDLICLFDETRYDPSDYMDARQSMIRATRNMCSTLSDRTADGYVFRTDLRLRPDPGVTPVCIAMETAERYYESLGRTWERAAYIKARPAAGDIKAGDGFLKTLRPFVWRRHLDFAAIQDAHDMRLRIRENKGLGGALVVPGHDVKLGRGGIREIEFFTQTRQLIAGGRDTGLRQRETLDGLQALAGKGWVGADVAEKLTDHYTALRTVEHRIQMMHDAQTHILPASTEGLDRVACLWGTDRATMVADLKARFEEVHELTEGFFAPDAAPTPKPVAVEITLDASILARWRTYPALRSQRASQIFDRLKPELLARLSRVSKPDEALVALDGFLAGLPAGVQLFSLFEANPQLIDLLVDIVGTSSELAGYLSRNSGVFDAVIGGDFFAEWPGAEVLQQELAAVLATETDYERQLDATRRWNKEWHFRIGVHHLRGLIDADTAGRQYAELAETVIARLMPVVQAQFAAKYGDPPGRGAVMIGMGSLGAQKLNAQSDLDMILVYDPQDAEMSDGPRPLATRPYYARLTQAIITALTAPMAQGRLYEVDMRLRPSGSQGPVATSWASFCDYQRNQAWVWEHLALTRARVVAGSADLAADVERFRRDVLAEPKDRGAILTGVAEMRDRIAAARSPAGVWDPKTGQGRMQDIELAAQAGALMGASADRDVASGLRAAVACGWLEVAEAGSLQDCYDLCWSVQLSIRMLSEAAVSTDEMSEGTAAYLCRSAGITPISALQQRLETCYDTAAGIIAGALERNAKDEAT